MYFQCILGNPILRSQLKFHLNAFEIHFSKIYFLKRLFNFAFEIEF